MKTKKQILYDSINLYKKKTKQKIFKKAKKKNNTYIYA